MPLYEYYCRPCNAKFEVLRPLSASDEAAHCPSGHEGASRVISAFATLRRSGEDLLEAPSPMGGGCACGGACSCAG